MSKRVVEFVRYAVVRFVKLLPKVAKATQDRIQPGKVNELAQGVEMRDEFRWREGIDATNCGIFHCDEARKLLFLFRDKVLQVWSDAKK